MASDPPLTSWLDTKAKTLVHDLAGQLSRGNAVSSMSPTVYDTAWVSMIVKTVDSVPFWRFPESFDYLLEKQLPNGGWEGYAAEVDGILNTMAALLSLKRHAAMPDCRGCTGPKDIDVRILKATSDLTQRLNRWDVESTLHVGFEILVPALLAMLEQDSPRFTFSGRCALLELNERKLAGFHPGLLYAKHKTTLIHSLEAFIGTIDFNSVRHHAAAGSMMASPSSTAAYLIHCHPWDDEAEAYLAKVIKDGPGAGCGSVPSAFPSTTFELTWTVSTLLEAGFSANILEGESLTEIANFLEAQLSSGGGVVGFAPQMVSDADDTARAIMSLRLLGRTIDPIPMIEHFESPTCFRTFEGERNPSFSANCNILSSLLLITDPKTYFNQILKATVFLCDTWDCEVVQDKWNISDYYPIMLLAQCLIGLLRSWDTGRLPNLPEALIQDRVPVILSQILTKVLQDQLPDGSWAGVSSYETTAYALIALKTTSTIPWAASISREARLAIEQATRFLNQHSESWQQAQHTWVEKVTYSSSVLSQVYCIAAARASSFTAWGGKVTQARFLGETRSQYTALFRKLPLCSGTPEWLLDASITESYFFQLRLEALRPHVFPLNDEAKPKYLAFIPITWIAAKNTCRSSSSNDALMQMMIISMLVYQADEYFEATIASQFPHDLQQVRDIINSLCQEYPRDTNPNSGSMGMSETNGNGAPASKIEVPNLLEVELILSAFVNYVLTHPKVTHAPCSTQKELRKMLGTFLLAHVTQIEDNTHLSSRSSDSITAGFPHSPDRSYFDWVRTTSADHTSCPFAFVFFTCLIEYSCDSVFINIRQKYLAQDMCRHLATMCRQYNDYGSVARDRAESNLNSLDFPEFDKGVGGRRATKSRENAIGDNYEDTEFRISDDDEKKQELMWLAEYERECLDLAVKKLEKILPSRIVGELRLFIAVTDLYGQMYVVHDLTSRIK